MTMTEARDPKSVCDKHQQEITDKEKFCKHKGRNIAKKGKADGEKLSQGKGDTVILCS